MNTEFIKNALGCVTQYAEGRLRIGNKAELAPGVLAVYVTSSNYFAVFFDRRRWKPTDTMIALWGDQTVLPSIWEDKNIGFMPTRDEGAHGGGVTDYRQFLKCVKRYLASDSEIWHPQPKLL